MIKTQRDILTEERCYLINEIDEENLVKIISYLYSQNIILITQKELIESKKGKTSQCHELLNILPKRGRNAFRIFIDALNEVGLKHAAQKLVERNEENDNYFEPLTNESSSTDIIDERDSILIAEVGEDIISYEGFVVIIDEGRNTHNESLSTLRNLFTRAHYTIYTLASSPSFSDGIEKIPILLLLRDIDEDYKDTIREKYDNKRAIIFTQDDNLNVRGAYIFHGPTTQIIDKLVQFLSAQNNNFSIQQLINQIGIRGTNNLTGYFKLEWRL